MIGRPTQVPWKCSFCGAKYLVTMAGFLTSAYEAPPCQKCGRQLNWTSMRPAAEFEPLFDTADDSSGDAATVC
jgi:DNA-directed RNA polymerase subunit RPC12/RpoP